MSAPEQIDLTQVEVADSWAQSVTEDLERSERRAWIIACVAAVVAVLEAIALVFLMPLKTVEPYTLLVDRQTGHVEALAPLDVQTIAPDAALTKSFLVQYVTARESFAADSIQRDYRRAALLSAPEERQRYIARMQANNPLSPLAYMPPGGTISVDVRSVSSLAAGQSLVRFTTLRTDRGGQALAPEYWAAVVSYGFSEAPMSEDDRLLNPLGFQVTRYRRDAETLAETPPPAPIQLRTSAAPQVTP